MLNPRRLLVVLAAMICAPSWGTVPQALSFQGYLTDRVGSPIADSQTITFSIYTVPVGGVPVWQETKSVAFSNGLFSTRLGELVAFSPDLFDVPLWIGMTVGSDSEMEPRRSLTSAGFSFRAEDSDTLQGQSAAELDQSGHVDDLSNPHAVSPAQTGAATQSALDTHAGGTGNPHAVTVGQTGGTPAGTFNVHAAGGSAHHVRYADAEAVTAMGVQTVSNPLNHDRYANSEAVGAILAADGDGSGLDSDLVDGLEATEIISAAAGAVGGPRYEFAGFSTSMVNGAVGFLGLLQACQAEFGLEARMANTAEVLTSATLSSQQISAWVRPSELIVGGSLVFDVPSSAATTGNFLAFTCDGWTSQSSGAEGLAVDASDYTFLDVPNTCDVARNVACSLPASQ